MSIFFSKSPKNCHLDYFKFPLSNFQNSSFLCLACVLSMPGSQNWRESILLCFNSVSRQCKLCPNTLLYFTLLYGQSTLCTKFKKTLIPSKFYHKFTVSFKSTAFCLWDCNLTKFLEL